MLVRMEDDRTLGENLKRFREAAGLTQAELAEKLAEYGLPGMYSQTIAKIEGNKRALKFEEGVRVASILDIDPGWLLGQIDMEVYRIVMVDSWVNATAKDIRDLSHQLADIESTRLERLKEAEAVIAAVAPDVTLPTQQKLLDKVRARVDEELRVPALKTLLAMYGTGENDG